MYTKHKHHISKYKITMDPFTISTVSKQNHNVDPSTLSQHCMSNTALNGWSLSISKNIF